MNRSGRTLNSSLVMSCQVTDRPSNPLPIDPLLPELIRSLAVHPNLVLEAPPGAGKTTRVPVALLESGLLGDQEILVLQPRRLAARLAARRVAEDLSEKPGETVGYQVRFEELVSARTRIRFMTEGILNRRLLADPLLTGVGAVLFDEFHERHLSADLSLALLRRLQRDHRPRLHLLVMSATLDAAPVADFLGQAPAFRAFGRTHPVDIEHLPRPDSRPLPILVREALQRLLDPVDRTPALEGDVLVFLPGAGEIRQCMEALGGLADSHRLLLLPLHGELPPAEQDRAVQRADRRKVLLSTNVAETSVTLPGVVAVIDSGLARIASHSPWSGLSLLQLAPISQASALQRAGRAGRTQPGRCLRLYTELEFRQRAQQNVPEVQRADLAEALLELHASGVLDPRQFLWLETPPPVALEAAEALLLALGALDPLGQLSPTGLQMLRFPVHPRQARLLIEAQARGIPAEGALLGALLGEREILLDQRARGLQPRARGGAFGHHAAASGADRCGPSDLLDRYDRFEAATHGGLQLERLRRHGLEPAAAQSVARAREQLRRLLRSEKPHPADERDLELAMLKAIASGYPDRIARRRPPTERPGLRAPEPSRELIFSGGGVAELDSSSVVRDGELVVALDADARGEGRMARPMVRMASAVEADWLLDLFPDRVEARALLRWNEGAQRVEKLEGLYFGNLAIHEERGELLPGEAGPVLWPAARQAGIQTFADPDALASFLARVAFVARNVPGEGLPALAAETLLELLQELCQRCASFAELREAGLLQAVKGLLSETQRQRLDRLAPERLRLSGGRQVPVQYPPDQPPFISSRLQDFFGLSDGPRVAEGQVPVVLHLLAPNQRAVQVTTDLAGFWARHYPALRRELGRRYPRHAWPEDPLSASPPPPRPPHSRGRS